MNVLIKILNAMAKEHWPKLLHVLCITLAAAIVCPVIIVITGLDNSGAMLAVKIILAVAILSPILRPICMYRYNRSAGSGNITLAQWWYSAIPVMIIAAVILLLGVFESTKPIGVTLGLIINTVALLIIGIYAFSVRFLYAALVEATTSSDVDIADSEINAKKMFQVVLAILAWEWAGAWFFVTFSPQLTPGLGIIAVLSLGIIVFTTYSLGFSGETGQKVLMYGAIATFTIVCLVLVDRAIQSGEISNFFLGGYIGQSLKDPQSAGAIGIVAWIAILLCIDLVGVTIAWQVENDTISRLTFVGVVTLATYLVGNWIASTGFSLKGYIKQVSSYLAPHTATLPNDVSLSLVIAGSIGVIISMFATISNIRRGNFPAWPMTIFSICALILYQLVPT